MKKQGFTLVELLLYGVLIGIVILSASIFLNVLQSQKVRSGVISEVEDNGTAAVQIMTQIIRNATSINSPVQGTSASSVSVVVPTGSLSPAVFALSSGAITVTEGASAAVNLTSAKVVISGLTFTNLTRSGSFGNIRITFTAAYNNLDGRAEFTYTKTFTADASLR